MNPRYNSGTSLQRTKKEEHLDSYERALQADFSDETYGQLKKLSMQAIRDLHHALQERLSFTTDE